MKSSWDFFEKKGKRGGGEGSSPQLPEGEGTLWARGGRKEYVYSKRFFSCGAGGNHMLDDPVRGGAEKCRKRG